MAKYNLPFVNINTFIYEPAGLELPETELFGQYDINFELGIKKDGAQRDFPLYYTQNTTGLNLSKKLMDANSIVGATSLTSIAAARNFAFQDSISSVPSTASWFNIINTKRNGPYGYCTWKQIRAHEIPLVRNQKKRNIFTVLTTINVDNKPVNSIEVFRERPVSFTERSFRLLTAIPTVEGSIPSIRYRVDLNNKYSYFDNNRLSSLNSNYNFLNFPNTDTNIINEFIDDTNSLLNGSFLYSFAHTAHFYPPVSSIQFKNRIRNNFTFPWNDDFTSRGGAYIPYNLSRNFFGIDPTLGSGDSLNSNVRASSWPLDIHQDYLTNTASLFHNVSGNRKKAIDEENAGVLQLKTGYTHTGILLGNDTSVQRQQSHPLYSYKHLISPLTSAVSPHGMNIEGVNVGTLYSNLSNDHLITGEAYWDAPEQYGKGPFENTYLEFIDDIKRKYKNHTIIPEFRSSDHFVDLQNKPSITPTNFLSIKGGQSHVIDGGDINHLGLRDPDILPESSSINPEFFDVYSHSDFIKHFDIAINLADDKSCFAQKIKLTCKGVKKFVPYEGFYPAQRTVQIAELFRNALYPATKYSGSEVGFVPLGSEMGSLYFNNIMQPMFGPGILYNSIKSGIAVDYPIHTGSLSIENGGIYKDSAGDHYIRERFNERIPFEALVDLQLISQKEIHCSNPHPSGNVSGSAKYSGLGDTNEYLLAMHNFLAETPHFFLQNQNMSFLASEKSSTLNINLPSGSVAVLNIRLYKSQNDVSDGFTDAVGRKFNSFFMTGSGIKETFTMYSNPQSFGPPNQIEAEGLTGSYSNLGYNWPFTPPYYDGISTLSLVFRPDQTRSYSISEIFNKGVIIVNRFTSLENDAFISSAHSFANIQHLNKYDSLEDLDIPGLSVITPHFSASMCHADASLNLNLGIVKEVDLLDDDTSDVIKVAVDISSQQDAQLIIQPKWETPMFNFESYTSASTVSLPLVGSQSAPRGMWHQYGHIETDPAKGIFMQVTEPKENYIIRILKEDVSEVSQIIDLGDKLGFSTDAVKLGKTAQAKVIREAVVAVPFLADTYNSTPPVVENRRKFFQIERKEIDAALNNDIQNVDSSVIEMVEKMQGYVMPPMFNFIEDENIQPKSMYIFEFSHVLDQEDLGAIWQNLPPKLMTSFEEQEVSVEHSLNVSQLLRTKKPSYTGVELKLKKNQRDVEIAETLQNNVKWLVFKVKQKAQQNYYDKVVGDSNKALNKTSPYSYNWPYDYFSLVELAKIEADVTFRSSVNPSLPDPSLGSPTQNPALVPQSLLTSIQAAPVPITAPVPQSIPALQTSVFGNISIPTTGSGGP